MALVTTRTASLSGLAPCDGALAAALERFQPAAPELLDRRHLLRRTDSKFVLGAGALPELLAQVSSDYALLGAGAQDIASYRTLYFDTPDLRCFHDHRRGRSPRHKVRVRHYAGRGLSFFEVKTKRSEDRTFKRRLQRPYGNNHLGEVELAFVRRHCGLPARELRPQLWTNFLRLTLVGLRTEERVTIDTELHVGMAEMLEPLRGVVVIEVKQALRANHTPFMWACRRFGLRPTSASKYCTAIALTQSRVRLNRLLPALRALEKVRM